MREKYNKYWGDAKKINFLVYLANIFDPRHKMEFVNFGVKFLFPDIVADVMKTIDKELHCLFDEYSSISEKVVVSEGQSSIPTKCILAAYMLEFRPCNFLSLQQFSVPSPCDHISIIAIVFWSSSVI
ncbi:hypothetical protein V6N13_004869 [Hibiscus sabdariffa]